MCRSTTSIEADRVHQLHQSLSRGTSDRVRQHPRRLPVEHTSCLTADLLARGAQVGTVDRFQGQEAAIALISMATSSGDDLPRQIEFLYSRNRLNVAISRAQCLAVIVASPRLLETSCSTIEQLRLVNALCWAKNSADGVV
jgi:hypothetical protein